MGKWRLDEHLKAYGLTKEEYRSAFRAGYSDGFQGYPLWAGNEPDFNPTAYKAGYGHGDDDRVQPES